MQDEIAIALVRALQIEVGADAIVSRPALRNKEAYTQYLRGLHVSGRFDQQGFGGKRLANYQRALISIPSEFADAAAMLAQAYAVLGIWGFTPPAIAFERGREGDDARAYARPEQCDRAR